MSYYDRYNTTDERATYPPQQQYTDQAEAAYDPYDNNQPHRSYDQGGYGYQEQNYGGYKDEPEPNPSGAAMKEVDTSAFDNDAFASSRTRMVEPKTSKAMRRWRHEHQGNLWTAGSRVRCCGRFFCCTIMLFLFFLVSVVLSLLLWIKPPNVVVGDVGLVTTGSPVQLEDDGVSVNLQIPVSVSNPNFFSVTFDSIDAQIFYPINNTNVGSGELKGLKIASEKQTNFTLPFSLNYTMDIDPQYHILSDIATKCGFTGAAASDITVNYALKLDFKILFVPIKPTIRNSVSIACPFSADDLAALLKKAGIDLGSLSTLIKALF